MCKTKKANVHEVRGSQYNPSAQDSEDTVNIPSDDRAHSLFLRTLSAKHPKGKTTVELPSRSKDMTKIQLTADPLHKHVTTIVCTVDTGAEVNVISEADYKQTFPNPVTRRLGPAQLLIACGGHQNKTSGNCQLYVHHDGNIKKVTFTMTDAPGPAIPGCKTCEELDLIKVKCSLESTEEKQVHIPLTKTALRGLKI